jgi:hypothetical protein
MGFLTQVFFAGIIFKSNDVVDNLVNNEALIKADATETTEVIRDAGNFVQDAKENKPQQHHHMLGASTHET